MLLAVALLAIALLAVALLGSGEAALRKLDESIGCEARRRRHRNKALCPTP